ncbi:MAG TPA: ATP-binding protein [Burkholderiaceae bacterium]|nr:ATP-binding protein [Burkholderiaceae bacterium]
MKSLAGRVFLILALATTAIQVLSFGGVLALTAREGRQTMFRFLAADVAFVQDLLRTQTPPLRETTLGLLNGRGYYELILQPVAQQNRITDDRSLAETAAPVQARLGPEQKVTPVLVPLPGDVLPALELPLDREQKLIVAFPDKKPPFAPPPPTVILLYIAVVSLSVMVVAWFAVRLATRPLARLAEAARVLGANLNAAQIPETGTTEVASAARAFNAMQRAIQKHVDERTQILASISHDLKTPLTRLRLRLANLSPADPRARCEEDIDAMNALVQEGLDYAASAQLRERRVPLDLNRLIEDLAERAGDMGQRVTTSGKLAAPLQCAPRALERAIQNLIDNAVKYGDGAHIALDENAEHVEIRIEDNGPGLPDELLEKAFDPFFRAEQSRSRETGGTGLGLSIARNLVRAHGGEIDLANRSAGGLTARIRLPKMAA